MSHRQTVDYDLRHEEFERWFQTPLGRALLADQRACVNTHVNTLQGLRQLHVGVSHRLPLASSSDFSQRIITTPRWHPHLPDGVVVCDSDELPFPDDTMDLVILHHSADFSAFPHQVLREAARVTRSGGKILILGFNPISLWGARKILFRQSSGAWGGRFLLRSRMEDWLNLLDFRTDSARSYFYRLPIQNVRLIEKLALMERLGGSRLLPIGAYYCILATKQVWAPIGKRPLWRRPNVIPLPAGGTLGVSRGYRAVNRTQQNGSGHGRKRGDLYGRSL
ncbi:MAG: class I SAM-dependent methyltransferase [Marinobacter sp.]|nr:class I SAM-dependent methyltransferase [Marinobacter sp.]